MLIMERNAKIWKIIPVYSSFFSVDVAESKHSVNFCLPHLKKVLGKAEIPAGSNRTFTSIIY